MNAFLLLLRNNPGFLILSLTLMSMPWNERINAWGIIALCVYWFWHTGRFIKLKHVKPDWQTSLSLLFFGLHLLGFFWSSTPESGLQTTQVKLGFLLFPILFRTSVFVPKQQERYLMTGFAVSCCLSFLYALSYDWVHHHQEGWEVMLRRMNVSEGVMHPGYYSNYFAFSLVWLSLHYLNPESDTPRLGKAWGILFILIHLLALLLLIAKTAILFLGLFACYVLWQLSGRFLQGWTRAILFVILILLSGALALQVPSISNRIQESQTDRQQVDKHMSIANSTGSRLVAWTHAWALIQKEVLTGYGTGEANHRLQEALLQSGYHQLARDHMHTHNQWLHTWLDIGMLGMAVLLCWLLVLAYGFYKQQNQQAGLWLLLLLLINLLTDDMLEVQAGVVFFLLLLQHFYYADKRLTLEVSKPNTSNNT